MTSNGRGVRAAGWLAAALWLAGCAGLGAQRIAETPPAAPAPPRPPRAAPAWRELTTAHFVLRSDAQLGLAERAIRELELYRVLLIAAMPSLAAVERRVEVHAFASEGAFLEASRSRPGFVGHVLTNSAGYQVITLWLFAWRDQESQADILAHELVHSLSRHVIPNQPRWFAEGLATELSQVAREEAGKRHVGGAVRPEFDGIAPLPLQQLFAWRGSCPAEERRCYATAWWLFRHLASAEPRGLEELTRRLTAGEPEEAAWNAAFPAWSRRGDGLAGLDGIVGRHAEERTVARELTVPREAVAAAGAAPEVRLLTPGEALTVGLEQLQGASREVLAPRVEAALRADAGHVAALAARADWVSPPEATALALRAVAAHPEDPAAWRLLGRSLLAPTAAAEREAAFRRAVALGPEEPINLLLLAKDREVVSPAESEALAARARRLAPWSLVAGSLRAAALARQGRCAEALEELAAQAGPAEAAEDAFWRHGRESVEHRCQPGTGRARELFLDAGLAYQGGQTELGLTLVTQAVAEAPTLGVAWRLRGFLERTLGRSAEALSSLRRASALEPRNVELLVELGDAQLKAGRKAEALKTLERAVALAPEPSTYNDAAYTLVEGNAQPALALAWAERAVRGHSEWLSASERLSTGVKDEGKQAAATRSLVAAWDTLGWILFRQGRLAEGERYLRAADGAQPGAVSAAHLGALLEANGRPQEAIEAYARAVALDAAAPARARLASLVQAGDVEARLAAARDALAARRRLRAGEGEGHPDALERLGGEAPAGDDRVELVLAADGTVAGVRPAPGAPLPAGAERLRGVRHGSVFPDARAPFVVLRARWRCEDDGCAAVLGSGR